MGLYLSTLDWHHFATLTTDRGTVSDWLVREYHNRFIRRVAFDAKQRIRHFFAVEHDSQTGRFAHLHALLHGTSGLTVELIRRRWPHGFTDVAPYDRRRHAAHYVVKEILFDPDSYGWSKPLPPPLVNWSGEVEGDFRRTVAEWKERTA